MWPALLNDRLQLPLSYIAAGTHRIGSQLLHTFLLRQKEPQSFLADAWYGLYILGGCINKSS